MIIIEGWLDYSHDQKFAIVQYSQEDDFNYDSGCPYEAKVLDANGEILGFHDGPGFYDARFQTLEEARDFLLRGIERQDKNPDIWTDMIDNETNIQPVCKGQ